MHRTGLIMRLSTSSEPSSPELLKFGVAALGVLLGVSGIIFDKPALGVLGVVLFLAMVITRWRSFDQD